jgi:hypothetical protein
MSAVLCKRCRDCGHYKPLEQYSREAKARDGLRNDCKPGATRVALAWIAANPDRYRANVRDSKRRRKDGTNAKWAAIAAKAAGVSP